MVTSQAPKNPPSSDAAMLSGVTRRRLKANLFKGLSDPLRLAIFETLGDRECTVTELVEATGASQGNVSNHLTTLRECGLVQDRRDGRYVYYRVSDSDVLAILQLAENTLRRVVEGRYACLAY